MIILLYALIVLVVGGAMFSFFSLGLLTRLGNEKLSWEHRMVISLAVLVVVGQSWLVYATGQWGLSGAALIMGAWLAGMVVGGNKSLRQAYKDMLAKAQERRNKDQEGSKDEPEQKN